MNKKIVVGLDFDGVVAYNPVRVMRAPVSWVKKKLLKKTKTSFFVPKGDLQRYIWTLIHKTSYFPAPGLSLLRQMAKKNDFEFHLVTARYNFLKNDLYDWLKKHELEKVFKSINVNEKNEQPHIFKAGMAKMKNFDFFVEDNLDIVLHMNRNNKTKVLWIYNLLDRNKNYENKFPNLKKALMKISNQ